MNAPSADPTPPDRSGRVGEPTLVDGLIGLLALGAAFALLLFDQPWLATFACLYAGYLIFLKPVLGGAEPPPRPRLSFEDGVLRFTDGDEGWLLSAEAIKVIGERCDTSLPFDVGYCVCFIAREQQYEVPIRAEGLADALAQLGEHFGYPLEPSLHQTSTHDNRVLWPPLLEGKPLFLAPATHLVGDVLGGPAPATGLLLTEHVLRQLGQSGAPSTELREPALDTDGSTEP